MRKTLEGQSRGNVPHIDKLISLVLVGYRLEPILRKHFLSFFLSQNKQANFSAIAQIRYSTLSFKSDLSPLREVNETQKGNNKNNLVQHSASERARENARETTFFRVPYIFIIYSRSSHCGKCVDAFFKAPIFSIARSHTAQRLHAAFLALVTFN